VLESGWGAYYNIVLCFVCVLTAEVDGGENKAPPPVSLLLGCQLQQAAL
jgi:hypothetical protein